MVDGHRPLLPWTRCRPGQLIGFERDRGIDGVLLEPTPAVTVGREPIELRAANLPLEARIVSAAGRSGEVLPSDQGRRPMGALLVAGAYQLRAIGFQQRSELLRQCSCVTFVRRRAECDEPPFAKAGLAYELAGIRTAETARVTRASAAADVARLRLLPPRGHDRSARVSEVSEFGWRVHAGAAIRGEGDSRGHQPAYRPRG